MRLSYRNQRVKRGRRTVGSFDEATVVSMSVVVGVNVRVHVVVIVVVVSDGGCGSGG